MQRAGKSRSGVIALVLIAASAAAHAPAPALAQVDEYELNLPDGGSGGSTDTTAPDTSTAPATTAPATTPTAPITTTPSLTAPVIDPVTGIVKPPKPPKPEPVYGSSSPNATLGPQEIPPLRFGDSDDGIPVVPVGLAALALAACGIGVWRLRYLRELPARTTGPPRGAASMS